MRSLEAHLLGIPRPKAFVSHGTWLQPRDQAFNDSSPERSFTRPNSDAGPNPSKPFARFAVSPSCAGTRTRVLPIARSTRSGLVTWPLNRKLSYCERERRNTSPTW